ncbi:MAG TPA: aminoglycoside phosphotransferase family protein [Kofleriaceae bacterium]|nr:aminoglycoside phosphotransferase family protein [Kofleriaceae bacterium]
MSVAEVAGAWGWRPEQISPLAGGLINQTFCARDEHGVPVAAVQCLHPIFGADVNLDLDAVTTHLAARGMATPRLLYTLDARPYVEHAGRVWRATTWVPGESISAIPDESWARAGGELVGRFHRAVADLVYDYKFVRAGVHDTQRHLAKLAEVAERSDAERSDAERSDVHREDLVREILDASRELPAMPELPRRHVHGDLKISNLIFSPNVAPVRGIALVDLDTLGKGTLAFELGDAMRSWCNPHGEDAGRVKLEVPLFAAAIGAFREVADSITTGAERRGIVVGLETVCVELAARFAVDVFEDRYFGWDPSRFSSRRAHNLVRAAGQLALAREVRAARDELLAIATM